MTRKYELRPLAQADLNAIWHYTEQRWDREQARAYTEALRDAVRRLTSFPEMGSVQFGPIAGYRKLSVESHAIYYRHGDEMLTVVRILHSRMNAERIIGHDSKLSKPVPLA